MKKYIWLLFLLIPLLLNPQTAGKATHGSSLEFDGSTNYVSISDPSFINDQQGSVEGWAKFSDLTTGSIIFSISINGFGLNDEFLFLYFRGDANKQLQPTLIQNTIVTWCAKTSDNIITDLDFHYYVITSDGSAVKLYLDCIETTITDLIGSNSGQWMYDATDANVFTVGGLLEASIEYPFNGMVDEVRVYSRVLDSTEMAWNYRHSGAIYNSDSLKLWLKMNEFSGSVIYDSSGEKNHGGLRYPITMINQINTATYDAFGLLIKTTNDTIIYFFREGATHGGDKGKIVKQIYTISDSSWSSRSDVYDDANASIDARNIGGGIIGNNVYVFFGRYNKDILEWVDMGYVKSTNLACTNWSSYTSIDVSPFTVFSSYGGIVSTDDGNIYLQPFYGWDPICAKVLKTTNSGDTWTVGATIPSEDNWGETWIAYIGDGKLVALLRDNSGGYVGQSISSDNGTTWSTVTRTNLGRNQVGVKMSCIYYDLDTEEVIGIYHDRSTPHELKVSITNTETVYAEDKDWNPSFILDTGFYLNGYPSIVKVSPGKYFLVYSKEASVSDADTWGGYYYPNSKYIWGIDTFVKAGKKK